MTAQHFVAELLQGHKGAAVIVPFDPAKVWGTRPVEHGVLPWREGHLVRGRIDGVAFDGWIGRRWGRFFVLVDAGLQRRIGARIGDLLQVELAPRAEPAASAARPAVARARAAKAKPREVRSAKRGGAGKAAVAKRRRR